MSITSLINVNTVYNTLRVEVKQIFTLRVDFTFRVVYNHVTGGDLMPKELIGPRLSELRTSQGISREELSEATGITLRSIESYERGERVPRDEVKIELAKFYGVSVQAIFFDK